MYSILKNLKTFCRRVGLNSDLKDIEEPVLKYLILRKRDDLKHYFIDLNNNQERCSSAKLIWAILWRLLVLIQFILCIVFVDIKTGKVPDYLFDCVQYWGGIPQFSFVIAIIYLLNTSAIILWFSFASNSVYRWLRIFQFINSFKEINSSKSRGEFKTFHLKLKFLINFVPIINKLVGTLIFFFPLLIFSINFEWKRFLFYGVPTTFIFTLFGSSISPVFCYSIFYYFLVCDYCRIRFKIFNKFLRNCLKLKTTDKYNMYKDFSEICAEVLAFNRFWNRYQIVIVFFVTPGNLLTLHQLLFAKLNVIGIIINIIAFVVLIVSQFLLNLMTSSINSESKKSYKLLIQIQRKFSVSVTQDLKVRPTGEGVREG